MYDNIKKVKNRLNKQMKTNNGETIIEKSSEKKRNHMTGLLSTGMLALPLAGLISGAMGMGSSAEQARATLHELVKDINVNTQTHEGLMPSAEALGEIAFVDGEGNLVLNEGYKGNQIEVDNLTSGSNLFEDIHSLEAYVRGVYGDNVPNEFLEIFKKVESESSYNQDSRNLALGSVAVGALAGVPGAIALTRSRSKRPSDPTSIDG